MKSNPMVVPPALKPLTSYIRRAEELDRDSAPQSVLVAYFCRSYAMELGIPLIGSTKDPASTAFLNELIQNLETTKKALPPFTQQEGKQLLTEFANTVFNRADEEDRAGLANKGTARTFYAAGNFYDALAQFGDIDNDIMQKKKYAKWKATEILKAIKEGREPTPGGFGDEAVKVISPRSENQDALDIPAAPTDIPANQKLQHQQSLEEMIPAAPAAAPGPPMESSTKVPAAAKAGKATKNAAKINDAKELLKFAESALNHKDTNTAIQRLEQALGILKSG